MLYLRNSWEDNKEVSVLQSVTLSAGTYKLTVDTKCISSTSSTGTLVAGGESTALAIHTDGAVPTDWDKAELTFFLAEETEVSLGVNIIFKGGEGSFLIDNFKLYQVMPVDEGDYLVVNAVTGNYLAGGLLWGTQSMEGGKPQFMTFELKDGGTYTIDSHQSNGGDSHYLGTNLYVDSGAAEWVIAEVDGGYTIYGTSVIDNVTTTGYLTGNGFQNPLSIETTAGATAVWELVTKDDIIASMADATEDNPVDVSALIPSCEPKRNPWGDSWTATGYNVSDDPGNCSFGVYNGGWASDCESYHSSNGFDIRQVIPELPAGSYTLTAQAFYRNDGTGTTYPVMYVDGGNEVAFPNMTSASGATTAATSGSMGTAYTDFLAGLYPISVDFTVDADDTDVTVGFTNKSTTDDSMWSIFGELGLLYLGAGEGPEPYTFEAEDWVASDNTRATADDITYNADGTITVAATGANNIALGNNPSQVWDATKAWDVTTAKKYITAEQEYFVIIGSNLSTDINTDSYWWWLNGINDQSVNWGQIAPAMAVTLTDGQVLVAWDISNYLSQMTADADGNIMLDGGTCFGLTTTGTSSTISDINFYTEDELNDMTKGELVYMTVYSCEAEPVSADDNTPAHWTAQPALDNGSFHINTWSDEGENDGSGMLTPFVEYWVGAGNGLADEFITHNALNLEAGTYRVSIDARAYNEGSTNPAGQGINFNVNGTDVALTSGTQNVFNGVNGESALVYGTYTIEDVETSDGNLDIRFVVASQENCDWLSWKNLKIEQLVNTRDLELTAVEGKMNATVAATQEAAIEAFYDTRTANDYYAAVDAIEAAEASVAFYAELTNLIETYVAALDEDGAAVWDASSSATGYEGDGENGYLTQDDIDAFMNDLIAAQAAQTTDNTDWSLVMKYTGSWEAPYSCDK